MQSKGTLQRFRNATWKTWLGAALVGWLLAAEAFAFAHQLDAAAHDNGQVCAVCVGAASFGAGAAPVVAAFEPTITPAAVASAVAIASRSVVPARRYARGPPLVSF
jgi:hypothetical protein